MTPEFKEWWAKRHILSNMGTIYSWIDMKRIAEVAWTEATFQQQAENEPIIAPDRKDRRVS